MEVEAAAAAAARLAEHGSPRRAELMGRESHRDGGR